MRNKWFHFFEGIVTVKLTGKGQERVINILTRQNIPIWDIKRHGHETITFKIQFKNALKLRHYLRGTPCKMEFLKRTGLPFFIKKMLNFQGFIMGALLFFVTIFLLSNMVWGVEIDGASPEIEHKIRKELNEMGVQRGKFLFLLDNPEGIQRKLTSSIEDLTWVGVKLQGTKYYLQVVERNIPKVEKTSNPQNLVATKKAIIVDMFVEEGQPMVDIYDHVKPGQILVSGEIGREGEKKLVAAKGEVWGETWYKTDVVLPLKSTFQVMTGKEMGKHYIIIGQKKLPIWGFWQELYDNYETERVEKKFRFYKWELPITYLREIIRESNKEERIYSEDEGVEMAKEMARIDMKNQLPEDAKIKGENILHQSIENGKVYLSIHFQVIENIAKSYPIIQGELE